MKKWEELKLDIERATKEMETEEPRDIYNVRTNQVGNEAGSYGEYWPAWDFVNGMIRDFSSMVMYPILKLAYLDCYDLTQLKEAYMAFHPIYTEYLGYSGLADLRVFCRRFRECFDEFENKDEFIAIYRSFLMYTNKLCAWSFHYFSWEIGENWKPQV